jgi:predicted transcriptional regulator
MSSMKYRSRTEIASQILDAASVGTTKTRIMYKAFLSYAQLKEYLEMLTVNGLLEYQASEEIYRTTAKGRKFLELYSSMGELVVDAAELAQTRR